MAVKTRKYLDEVGLAYLWGKTKTYVEDSIEEGKAASAVKLEGPVHSYTTAANAAKNWYRIANASTSQIDTTTPLHAQFLLKAYNTESGVAYYEEWFVDVKCFGQNTGVQVFGSADAPFSQIRILYENTAASVNSSTRPAIDIYLNNVLTTATHIEIEEVLNKGWTFLADGTLEASVVPSGYENRAQGVYQNGLQYAQTADYTNYSKLNYTNISANKTLTVGTNDGMRILNCTGTITLTIPTCNSNQGWFWIKNNGSGVITLHPASASVYFDNVSENIVLQSKEYILIACQSSGHYSIVNDGRWKSIVGSSVMHLDGDETIGGTKTFTNTIQGSISGNAGTATKATQDGDGNVIAATYAPLASPALTGTPTAPTATAGTNTTQIATTEFVSTAVANLVDSSPEALNTLNELASALGNDPNFATTVAEQIGTKANDSAVVHIAGSESITGAKTFTNYAGISKSGEAMFSTKSNGNETSENNYELKFGIGTSGRGGIFDVTRGTYILERTASTGTMYIRAQNDAKTATGTYTFGTDGKLTATTFSGIIDGTIDAADKVVVTNSSKKLVTSSITPTQLGYLSGATGNIQSQIDLKADDSAVVHNTGDEVIAGAKTFSSNISSTAGKTSTDGSVTTQFGGQMGSSDSWRIGVGSTASDQGFVEFATMDNGSEPIYVRQYNTAGGTTTPKNTITLLDANGNTTFPGTVTAASFVGTFKGSISAYDIVCPETENSVQSIPPFFHSLIDESRSCKTAFLPAANVTVEYSIDGGTTWLDYGATDVQKAHLFAMTRGVTLSLGKAASGGTSELTTDCKLRITYNAQGRYAAVDTLYLYVDAFDHTMYVDIERSTFENKTTFTSIRDGVQVAGWSGPNVISLPEGSTFGGYGDNQPTRTYAYRLTFYCTNVSSSNKTSYPWVSEIRMYGSTSWITANSMMSHDHIYSWDVNQSVTFPNNVAAVSFTGNITGNVTGNADTSTKTKGVYLVIPDQTAQTATLTASVTGITEYFPGLMVAYRAPFNTAASSTLNINSLGAKPIYYGVNTTSKDYYPANRLILLVYETTTTSTGCWKMVYSYDGNSNTYDRRMHNNSVKAAAAVTAGTIIVGSSAGYKTAASGVTFDLSYPILYASAAIAANATATNTYDAIPSVNLQTTKASWTGTQYATVYLVGTISGNTVTIDSSVFTTTVPTTADGKVYIPLGVLYSTYQVFFDPVKDIYHYTNGSFHRYDPTTAATGSSNGTIKINGTDVAVKGLGAAAYTNSTAYAAATHNQASNSINAMTGYSKAASASAIAESDSLNAAIGKLEKALDGKQASGTYLTPSSTLDATKLSGTIPASCYTNTTYSNGTGLNLSGTTFSLANTAVTAGSYGQASSASPAHGAKISVPYITVDAQGRITSATTSEITLPSDNNTDTLMTQSKSTTNSAYPILMTPTANANADQGAKTGIFGAGVRINPSTSSIIVDGMDAIRFRQSATGKYTSFIRNDGSSTYWLLTNVNDPDGTWNSLRPLIINNATGQCSISGNAATATKATQDASGNVITTTYATKTELTNSFKGNARTIEFIAGTQTAVTGALTGSTEDSALYDGKTIFYYMPYNGSGNATLELTLADGTKTGAKVVYWSGTSRMTTHYGAGSVVRLTYRSTDDCWHGGDYDYNANNYDRRLHNNNVKMATAVAANTVIVGTSAGYKQAASGITFDLAYPILVATEAKAAAAVSAKTYEAIPTVNLQTTKASWTGTQYAMAFLVGTLSGNTVTIDSSVFTTTVPTTADGKIYIPIGLMASTYQIYFASSKDVYQYTNGSFHLLDTTTAATGSTNGTIKINGTEVAVKGLGTAAYTASTAYLTSSSTLDATKLSGTIPSGCYTNTWTAMTGATSSANGTAGYINAVPPKDGYNTKFWRADGSWQIPYTHPTTSGNKHIPSGGSSGQFLKWSADGTATWAADNNSTTHLYAGASGATANSTSATANNATYLVVCDDSTARNSIKITGTNGTTVSANGGTISIDSAALSSVTNAQIDTLFA